MKVCEMLEDAAKDGSRPCLRVGRWTLGMDIVIRGCGDLCSMTYDSHETQRVQILSRSCKGTSETLGTYDNDINAMVERFTGLRSRHEHRVGDFDDLPPPRRVPRVPKRGSCCLHREPQTGRMDEPWALSCS